MAQPEHFLHQLYCRAKEKKLIIGACKACFNKLGAVEAITKEIITLIGEMSGHPAMADYINQGYRVRIF